MKGIFEIVQSDIEKALSDLPPEDLELAQQVGQDSIDLMGEWLQGVISDEDLGKELAHLHSQAASLKAAARARLEAAIFATVGSVARKILIGSLG